ncbi:rhomboid family intramembrane serine protease [Alloscardovia venturai]|uniref:Rhomboid family intramembrane serine protease n=1 Tax=Alloscardovia venturai TaxID=1769421 RepID=A0ABW2Y6F2_9BIFI
MANSGNPFTRGTGSDSSVSLSERIRRMKRRWQYDWRNDGPVVTSSLIAVNIVVFIVQMVARFIPQFDSALSAYGALSAGLSFIHPWTLLTNAFMHVGFIHILLNMLALYAVGRELERLLGHWPFLGLYMVSALGSSVTYVLWYGSAVNPIAMGASGAIYGLFGALFVAYNSIQSQSRTQIILFFLLMFVPSFFGNVAWQAHIGGFIFGCILASLMTHGVVALRSKNIGVRMWIYGSGMSVVLILLWIARWVSIIK